MIIRFILPVIVLYLFSCGGKEGSRNIELLSSRDSLLDVPVIEFIVDSHDFGKISEGEKISFTFPYTNSGKGGLIINSASASCGCTVPSYSKEPLLPGEKGKIEILFDSNGRLGVQHKTIAIRTNGSPGIKILDIYAEVIENNK